MPEGSQVVTCRECKAQVDVSEADIVPGDTGYRCRRCATNREVAAHLQSSEEAIRRTEIIKKARTIRWTIAGAVFVFGVVVSAVRACEQEDRWQSAHSALQNTSDPPPRKLDCKTACEMGKGRCNEVGAGNQAACCIKECSGK